MVPTIRQFSLFLVTGGTAAIVNMVCRHFFSFHVSYEAAVVLAYPCGMAVAYTLARCFVFQPSDRSKISEVYRFFLVNVFGLMVVWCVSVTLYRLVFPWIGFEWNAEAVAHFCGLSTTAFTSYIGHRFFTFSRAKITAGES